uniref:Uncharacterized protein n=1 Tax=Ciona savignyi TaxID=51511 RepID=H2YSN8_CIOSA
MAHIAETLLLRQRYPGRVLKVTLESDAVGITEIYRGFKVRFATSLRLPSPRMRDSGGLWTRYRLTLNGATLPTYTTTLRAVSTRNPNEVDSNNNAAIDIRNSRQNNQPTSNSNEERNRRINDENNRNIVSPTVIVTARPDRFVFHRRTIRTPTRNRVKYRPQPSTPSRRNPNKEAKKRLSEGVIAGIVVGLLVIIVVLSGTVYKIVSR